MCFCHHVKLATALSRISIPKTKEKEKVHDDKTKNQILWKIQYCICKIETAQTSQFCFSFSCSPLSMQPDRYCTILSCLHEIKLNVRRLDTENVSCFPSVWQSTSSERPALWDTVWVSTSTNRSSKLLLGTAKPRETLHRHTVQRNTIWKHPYPTGSDVTVFNNLYSAVHYCT